MADHRQWWKLWYSALYDEKLDNLDPIRWVRWVRLNVWINHHGEHGVVTITEPARSLCQIMLVTNFCNLQDELSVLPGIVLKRDGIQPVTLTIKVKHWHKYQHDTSAERMRRHRAKRDAGRIVTDETAKNVTISVTDRREERRGEEKEQVPYAAPLEPHGMEKGRRASGPDPNIKLLLDFYHDTYLAIHKTKPVISGGKEGAICRKLLAGRTLEEARWIVEEHLKHPPDLYERKNLYGLNHVLAAANTILARKDESL